MANFNYLYVNNGSGFFHVSYMNSLVISDDIDVSEPETGTSRVSDSPPTSNYYGYYQGVDAGNNPYFSANQNGTGQITYLSNTLHSNPATEVPSYGSRSATTYVGCFLTGTMIATPDGERAVETLAAGDLVLTADGRAVPVKWMGRQTVAVIFDRIEDYAPICIDAGALGDNLPVRDLKLTADHALLIDSLLVQAGALVDGAGTRRMTSAELGERYTVWHIETEGHDLVVAEGCAAETFIDNASRRRFDNHAEYEALFGDVAQTAEMDLPRVKSARQLPTHLRRRVAA